MWTRREARWCATALEVTQETPVRIRVSLSLYSLRLSFLVGDSLGSCEPHDHVRWYTHDEDQDS